MKKCLTAILAASMLISSVPSVSAETTSSAVRQMEHLDRGTVAVSTTGGVYLSWRLLGTENYDTSFDIYRGSELIATVSDSTNYTDANGSSSSSYTVVPSGSAVSVGKSVSVWNEQYLTIPLDVPAGGTRNEIEYTYTPNDAECADLDGDGEYEIILKWDPSNSFDPGKSGAFTGNVYIDAYKLNGTKLWRIDLGININAGAHFTPFIAYDFDLDGKAEVAMKTAPGSLDGQGNYVSAVSSIAAIRSTDNNADYRGTDGRVLSGDEYYTVFSGETGAALDTVYYPHPRGTISEWGDGYGNRSERFLATVAYLDGVTPSMVTWRGYYAKTTAAAYNLVNKKLVKVADFNTDTYNGVNSDKTLTGNGNHNLAVADVDQDGKDEILSGAIALEYDGSDFSVLWCSERGHGDALHLADYDPTHDGMEYFSVHEASPYGMTVYDAASGEELFHVDNTGDTGRGVMAHVGYAGGYYEIWGAGTYTSFGGTNIESASYTPDSSNFRIFWDADTYDELLDGTGSYDTNFKISDNNGRVDTLRNAITNNYTKCNPCLQADILGDWREELVVRSGSGDEQSLLVYTTTHETTHKLYTLMHDPAYRMQVSCQNAGYNQPPHIGYYIDEANSVLDMRMYSSYIKTVSGGTEYVRDENITPPVYEGPTEYAWTPIYSTDLNTVEAETISVKAASTDTLSDCNVPDYGTGTALVPAIPALDGWGYMHYGYTAALTEGRQSLASIDAETNTVYIHSVANSGSNGAISFIPTNCAALEIPSGSSIRYEFDATVKITGGSRTNPPSIGFTSSQDGSSVTSIASTALAASTQQINTYPVVMEYNTSTGEYSITVGTDIVASGTSLEITGIYAQGSHSYNMLGISGLTVKTNHYEYYVEDLAADNGTITYTVSGYGKAATLYCAAFANDGRFIGAKIADITGDEEASGFTVTSDDFGEFAGVTKAFIWKDLSPLGLVNETARTISE